MEIVIIAVVAVIVGAGIYLYNQNNKSFDLNKDGKVDKKDADAAVSQIKQAVTKADDVNKDGKVTVTDVREAAAKAKNTVKKAAVKSKTAGRTARAKKKAS